MNRRRLVGGWGRFWFTPQSTSSLAIFRIALGLVTFLWGVALLPYLQDFFTRQGVEPVPVDVTWGLLGHFTSNSALYCAYAMLLVSALCVMVGFRTRLTSIVMFVMVFSFIQRTHSIFNSGDGLLRILCFFLVFMPAGESLSVDRWRRHRENFWECPARAPWALRLVQIQVSVLYLSAAFFKIKGGGWTDGSALPCAGLHRPLRHTEHPGCVSHAGSRADDRRARLGAIGTAAGTRIRSDHAYRHRSIAPHRVLQPGDHGLVPGVPLAGYGLLSHAPLS